MGKSERVRSGSWGMEKLCGGRKSEWESNS